MYIQPISNLTFNSKIKKLFKQGKLKLDYGLYGERLTVENVSDEHIICKCFGGTKDPSNIALADVDLNNKRGCQPIELFTTIENVHQYCKQFLGIRLPGFNGDDYANGILKTFGRIFGKES